MKRRRFIHLATASVIATAVAGSATAALRTIARQPDYLFFDERFREARRIATTWESADRRIPVTGDITPLWSGGLERRSREQPLRLRGVTTDSFLFCLRVLAHEHAHLDVQVSRFDRNLLLWTMTTTPKIQ